MPNDSLDWLSTTHCSPSPVIGVVHGMTSYLVEFVLALWL